MNDNMTLLSQTEIDTLVQFLLEKKQDVNNEVLNQDSIDRLIHLIHTTQVNSIYAGSAASAVQKRIQTILSIREDESQVCELKVEKTDSGFIDILITNQDTNITYKITPTGASELNAAEDGTQWGRCVSPLIFIDIAEAYSAKFSEDTYEKICSLYAEVLFGDKEYRIPAFFLPDKGSVARALL